jgi:hypothetical protein
MRAEFDIKINNTNDQYLFINEQVKKKNPGYLCYLSIHEQGKHNLIHMISKNFNFWLLHIAYNSNVFLSVIRVILSDGFCFCASLELLYMLCLVVKLRSIQLMNLSYK